MEVLLEHSWHEEQPDARMDISDEVSEDSSVQLRKKRYEASQFDQDTRRDLNKVIKKLKEMKKIWKDQHLDQKDDSNPLSLEIQEKMVPTTIRIPKEKYNGMSNPTD